MTKTQIRDGFDRRMLVLDPRWFLIEAVLESDSHPTRTPRRSAIIDSGRS